MPTEEIVPNEDLRRLTYINQNARNVIFVCQPGRDELDESILRAVNIGL